jgi:hypothetical protein
MNPLITALLGGINIDGILGRFFPSKEKAQEFRAEMERELTKQEGEITKAALAAQAGQIAVNEVEAAHASLFVAGWRPFIGWVCGSALAWQYIGYPIAGFLVAVFATDLPPLPKLDGTELYPVLMGMLGLGGMRTFEKVKGIARAKL